MFDWGPKGRGRGVRGSRQEEWTCQACGVTNWMSRHTCRRCAAKRGTKRTARTGKGSSSAAPAEAGVPHVGPPASLAEVLQQPKPSGRPPAPETKAAETDAKAVALETSAATLEAAGLTAQAKSLKEEAALLRKQALSMPRPGRRLDLLEGYVKRCGGRAQRERQAEEYASKSFEVARQAREAADMELEDAKVKLEQLRVELAAVPTALAPPQTKSSTVAFVAAGKDEVVS